MESDFHIDTKTGLGSFPSIESSRGIRNLLTYSNKVWGNMNPYWARTEEEKNDIEKKDLKIAELMQAKTCFVATTPQEDSFIDLNRETFAYLQLSQIRNTQRVKFIPLRVNGIIAHQLTEPAYFVFAPADCPIYIFVHPDWEGFMLIHEGSPHTFTGLHIKMMTYFKAHFPKIDTSKFEVFLTPYICPKHYSISREKFDAFLKDFRNRDLLVKYTSEGEHADFPGKRYYFDFVGLVKEELHIEFGIDMFHESGLCTYEEAKNGNLFSHELLQETEVTKERGDQIDLTPYQGSYNVAIGYPH